MNGARMNGKLVMQKGEEVDLLTTAFNAFTQATQRLKESYQDLKEQVATLNRKLAEANERLSKKVKELDKTKSYLNNILDSMMDGLIAIDNQERISIFNQSAEALTNQRAEKILKMPFSEVLGEKNKLFASILKETLKEGKPLMGKKELYINDNKVLPLEVTTNLIKGKAGRIEGALMVFRDISPIRQLEEEIQRQNRLAMLGEMAASVAHEIRNPLSGIEGFALLLKDVVKEGKEKEWITNIVRGTRSLNNIITNLLNFARPLKPNFQEVELKGLIAPILPFILQKIQREKLDIRICNHFPLEPIKMKGDPNLLKQCFLNLMLNAVQSISGKGEIAVSVEKKIHPYPTPYKFLREWKGDYIVNRSHGDVYIKFSDTGCGISQEEKGKIFSPFFTTRAEGIGLGLAITRRIVQSHGGSIEVKSKVNKGSTFIIRFPLNHSEE